MNEPKLKLPLCWVFSSSLSLFFSSRSPFVVAAGQKRGGARVGFTVLVKRTPRKFLPERGQMNESQEGPSNALDSGVTLLTYLCMPTLIEFAHSGTRPILNHQTPGTQQYSTPPPNPVLEYSKKRRDKQQFSAPPTHSPAPTATVFPFRNAFFSVPASLRTGSTPHTMLHILFSHGRYVIYKRSLYLFQRLRPDAFFLS
jgi:hypothetical protein